MNNIPFVVGSIKWYNYPDIPPSAHLLNKLQNNILLNNWEFYQSVLQGIYKLPAKKNWIPTFINPPPIELYYWSVVYIPKNNPTNKDAIQIRWNYTQDNAPYPSWSPLAGKWATNYAEFGKRTTNNNWVQIGQDFRNSKSFYLDYPINTKFNYLGQKI